MRIILRNSIDQTSSLISLNCASSSKDSKEESNFLSAKSSRKKMDLPNVSSKTSKPIYSSISSTWRSKVPSISAPMKNLENISKQQLSFRSNWLKSSETRVVQQNNKSIHMQTSIMRLLNILTTTRRISIRLYWCWTNAWRSTKNTRRLWSYWPIYSSGKEIWKEASSFVEYFSEWIPRMIKLDQSSPRFYWRAINMKKRWSNSKVCLKNSLISIQYSLSLSISSGGTINSQRPRNILKTLRIERTISMMLVSVTAEGSSRNFHATPPRHSYNSTKVTLY